MRLKRPALDNITSREIFDRVKFRTKFQVAFAEWNPKIDLLALGSSEGDVVVKRYLWKTGWKRNFSRKLPLKQFESLIEGATTSNASSTQQQQKDELLSLCWSPNGQVLLVSFASGRSLYLDTQTGNTRFIRNLGYMPMKVSWLKSPGHDNSTAANKQIKYSHSFTPQGDQQPITISSVDFNFGEDAPKEHGAVCADVELFYSQSLRHSMAGTFLCIMHLDGPNTLVDILADGILLVQRLCVEDALSACLKCPIASYQISTKAVALKRAHFCVPFNVEDENIPIPTVTATVFNGPTENLMLLQFPSAVTQNRQRIYSQIADCLGWLSFCCLYLQEMLNYCTNNWQQASEAFHQRVFAIVNIHRLPTPLPTTGSAADKRAQQAVAAAAKEGALEMCRDLLVVLEDGEASDLLDKFFSSSTTEKELKLASGFVTNFSGLIKGISSGLQPVARSLRNTICQFRSHLSVLAMNLEEENEAIDPAEIFLATLLEIAADHPAFEPMQNLSESCEQFLTKFEQSIIEMEQKLLTVMEVAEKNMKELDMLLHWLIALIFESGNECSSTIDESLFDVKQLKQFISELVRRTTLNDRKDGKCILDRVYSHIIPPATEEDEPQKMEVDTEEEAEGDKEEPQQKTAIKMEIPEEMQIKVEENEEADSHQEQEQPENSSSQTVDDTNREEENKPPARVEPTKTLGQYADQCFTHFRTLFNDGIEKIVHFPFEMAKCSILPNGQADEAEMEEGGTDEAEEEEEAEEKAASNEMGKGSGGRLNLDDEEKLTLHAFIFGSDQQQPPPPPPPPQAQQQPEEHQQMMEMEAECSTSTTTTTGKTTAAPDNT